MATAAAAPEDCREEGGLAECVPPGALTGGPGPWQFHLCDDGAPYVWKDRVWCETFGGTWSGAPGRECSTSFTRPAQDEPLLPGYAETFLRRTSGVGPCPYTFEDRGWLAPGERIESWFCWSGGPWFQNGIEVRNLRETILRSETYFNRDTGRCEPRQLGGRVIILRIRTLDAPRCPAGYRLRYRADGTTPECWRLPPVACTIALEGLPAEVEPGRRLQDLTARVRCTGRSPEGLGVAITPAAVPTSGGHAHHDASRPPGTVNFPQGPTTDATGRLPFVFTAPAVAGDHTLSARCLDLDCGQATGVVWVGYRGLSALPP